MAGDDTAHRQRGTLLLLVAAVAFLCYGGDYLALGTFSLAALGLRATWALSLVACAVLARRLPARRFEWVALGASLCSVAGWVALTVLTGGSGSPYFHWMSALPLIVGALSPGSTLAIVGTAVATLAANLLVLAVEVATGPIYGMWTSFAVTVGVLALFGNRIHLRLERARRAADEARIRAQDDLAMSEKRRLHAEKLALLGSLSRGVAHEINNPLAFVKSNLALLAESHGACAGSDHLAELLADCAVGLGRIEAIVGALRSFAYADEAGIQPCAVVDVVQEALQLASPALGGVARVEWQPPALLPLVRANRSQLVQVLVHLLINAADAIREKGAGTGTVRIEAAPTESGARVDVIDSGVGLRPEVHARLFQPFFTTKPTGAGTGLGLALSREYLQRFGATLEPIAESTGSRFRLVLPAASGR